jgi:proline dehydrogenase
MALLYRSNLIRSSGPENCVDNSSQTTQFASHSSGPHLNVNSVLNPTRPIESSVQSPYYLKISSQQSSRASRYQMRDLYDRRKRLADCIKRVNEDVDEPDRTDILKLIEHVQDREKESRYSYLNLFIIT